MSSHSESRVPIIVEYWPMKCGGPIYYPFGASLMVGCNKLMLQFNGEDGWHHVTRLAIPKFATHTEWFRFLVKNLPRNVFDLDRRDVHNNDDPNNDVLTYLHPLSEPNWFVLELTWQPWEHRTLLVRIGDAALLNELVTQRTKFTQDCVEFFNTSLFSVQDRPNLLFFFDYSVSAWDRPPEFAPSFNRLVTVKCKKEQSTTAICKVQSIDDPDEDEYFAKITCSRVNQIIIDIKEYDQGGARVSLVESLSYNDFQSLYRDASTKSLMMNGILRHNAMVANRWTIGIDEDPYYSVPIEMNVSEGPVSFQTEGQTYIVLIPDSLVLHNVQLIWEDSNKRCWRSQPNNTLFSLVPPKPNPSLL